MKKLCHVGPEPARLCQGKIRYPKFAGQAVDIEVTCDYDCGFCCTIVGVQLDSEGVGGVSYSSV